MREGFAHAPRTLADYLAIARRRKWILIAVPLLAAAAAYGFASTQAPLYEANAQILVNRAGIVTAITNVQDPATYDATRFLTTQSTVARSPTLAARVVAAAKVPGITAGEFLGRSRVTPRTDADLLDVAVSHPNPDAAVRLVNAYALEFTRYKTQLDTGRINAALRVIRAQTASLRAEGRTGSAYETLIQYQGQLETVGKLMANNTSVLQTAAGAGQIEPRPKQNAVLGAFLGAVLGLGLVLLLEALDRRVRSGEEVEAVLGLPLLGRLPAPPRQVGNTKKLVMLDDPMSVRAETYRKLRTSIEFANLNRGARTFMFTSGVQGEGKSTTIANLAVAFARADRRVALVDLDIRRPTLHTYFEVRADQGIADVVLRNEELDRALQHIILPRANLASQRTNNGRRAAVPSVTRWGPSTGSAAGDRSDERHTLHFLAAGNVPPSSGEFLQNERVPAALAELGDLFDIVLVDAPPFLAVGDAMTLSAYVDTIVVVNRLGTQRPILRELARELHHCQAPCLGFVLTGVSEPEGYGYGYGYGDGAESYGERPRTQAIEAPKTEGGRRASY